MKLIPSMDLKALNLQSEMNEFSRKVKEETLVRSLFVSFKPQIKGHPKKEYLRCKLIRGHKRANRKIKKGKLLYNNMRALSTNAKNNWESLSEVYHKNPEVLDSVSKTMFEPIKFKSKAKPTAETSRSFNTDFCRRYFRDPITRESFFYFVEYLFCDLCPFELSKALGFSCCRNPKHTLECAYKWLLMKRYANQVIIQDLKLEPWLPESLLQLPGLIEYLELKVEV